MGAILIKPGGEREYFGLELPRELSERWASEASMREAHVIGQAEVVPIMCAYFVWREELRGKAVIVFIDNEGARFGLVAARSKSRATLPLIGQATQLAARLSLSPWYERVPGPMNVGDAPSRLDFKGLESAGAARQIVTSSATHIAHGQRRLHWPRPL